MAQEAINVFSNIGKLRVLPAKRVPKKKKHDEEPAVEAPHHDDEPFSHAALTPAQ